MVPIILALNLTATAPPVNLPPPTLSCAAVVGAAGAANQPITPDLIGRLYAGALKQGGMKDKGSPVTPKELIQAFSNVMDCFVPAEKK